MRTRAFRIAAIVSVALVVIAVGGHFAKRLLINYVLMRASQTEEASLRQFADPVLHQQLRITTEYATKESTFVDLWSKGEFRLRQTFEGTRGSPPWMLMERFESARPLSASFYRRLWRREIASEGISVAFPRNITITTWPIMH